MIEVDIQKLDRMDSDGGVLEILGRIRFCLNEGERLAVLGPSGVGKTTLLHVMAGLNGEFQGRVTGLKQPVGMVFQAPRLLPWRTALQNLRVVAPDRSDAEFLSLLDQAGVGDAAGRYPGQLSLGMARRVAIARALAVGPSILLLDEPFASLDAGASDRMRSALSRILAAQSMPAVLVTHDPAEALQLADRVLVLGGSPASIVLDHPTADLTPEDIARSVALE